MGTAEKFCLRWNDFESNISVAFRELREDKDFFDVTLACDDDQIQAHKVILSACSPFFRTILKRNRHEHPLLYLKGVKYIDLMAVLNFMYHGEVNVAQEELNSFLAVAEDLKVKGLTQNSSDSKSLPRSTDLPKPRPRDPPDRLIEATPPPKRPRPPPPMPRSAPPPPSSIYHPEEDDIQEVVPVKSEPISHHPDPPNHTHTPAPMAQIEQPYIAPAPQAPQMQHEGVVADPNMEYGEEYGEYEGYEVGMDGSYEGSMLDNSGMGGNDGNKELSEMVKLQMDVGYDLNGLKVHSCKTCNFQAKVTSNLRSHVEAKHMKDRMYQCIYCGISKKTWQTLQVHMKKDHEVYEHS
eukprot:GFUD01127996.1.p1 GENE.GFUD01127996.1~~GFUD01127996.1.p1  ORF type:complete len:359 (+),score=85.43 GFUD01127996.1:26-1078(+)